MVNNKKLLYCRLLLKVLFMKKKHFISYKKIGIIICFLFSVGVYSRDVYYGRNVSAAAVAPHECGHAVQHATAYPYLKFRSAMVPVQNASAKVMNIIIMVMMFGGYFLFKSQMSLSIVVITLVACQSVITLFALITLPVEFDASNRGLAWLTNKGIVVADEEDMAKDALKWAAMTYVVAALSAVATLLYYIMMLVGRRD